VGDELIKVDGKDVTHESIMAVRGMILGAVGTAVEMTFVREDDGKEPESYTVCILTYTRASHLDYTACSQATFLCC
jgi:C-terminal processing protease CtpA/Prc